MSWPYEPTRRALAPMATGILSLLACPAAHALTASERHFVDEAARMRRLAIDAGDQAFGAVIVMDGRIVGYGPSRVVIAADPDAHAERVALWDAQRRLGSQDLSRAVSYSTSRPCSACETAMAAANIDRMRYGPAGTDAGRPRRR